MHAFAAQKHQSRRILYELTATDRNPSNSDPKYCIDGVLWRADNPRWLKKVLPFTDLNVTNHQLLLLERGRDRRCPNRIGAMALENTIAHRLAHCRPSPFFCRLLVRPATPGPGTIPVPMVDCSSDLDRHRPVPLVAHESRYPASTRWHASKSDSLLDRDLAYRLVDHLWLVRPCVLADSPPGNLRPQWTRKDVVARKNRVGLGGYRVAMVQRIEEISIADPSL